MLEGGNLIVSFTYHPKLVETIKSKVSKRRFEGARKVWVVPVDHWRQVQDAFSEYPIRTVPPDLFSMLEAGTAKLNQVECIVCGQVIDCEKCEYTNNCGAKLAAKFCICPRCLEQEGAMESYSLAVARRVA